MDYGPYGSPVLMVVDGLKTIVTPTQSGLVGVGLADGKLLWQVPFGTKTYQSSLGTPIADGTTVSFFCRRFKPPRGLPAIRSGTVANHLHPPRWPSA